VQLQWRYISVALFLGSPPAGVTRYPCPVEPGLSSQTGLSPRPRGCPACLRCTLYRIPARLSNGNRECTPSRRIFIEIFSAIGYNHLVTDYMREERAMSSTIQDYLASLRGKRVAVIGIGVSNTPLIKMLLRSGI